MDHTRMQETKIERSDVSAPKVGLWGWLDRRTGVDAALRSSLYEPIPGGARFAYVFGSGLLFIFISQVITGVFIALY
jgi:ubiquinol-cytochrome c reductase cytochrome b subunit